MKTLALFAIGAVTLLGSMAHANDIDHWAGDDGKRFYGYYPPGFADDGYVRSFNGYSGEYPRSAGVVRPAPVGTAPLRRRPLIIATDNKV
jgi:hypothetical protein